MAGSLTQHLTQQWNSHAFPDDEPARELVWAEQAERRVQETRLENYLDASGSDLRIRRFSTGKDSRQDKIDARRRDVDDLARLAVGSPAYMEAYNNKLTFQIGGEDVEITQGEMHDLAKRRAEDLQQQIDAAKRRGASAEEVARMQATLDQVLIVRDTSDPTLGKMDEDDHRRVQAALTHPDSDPVLSNQMKPEARFGRDQGNEKTGAEDLSARMHHDAATEAAWMQWSGSTERASVASRIDNGSGIATDASLKAEFTVAAEDAPIAPDVADEQPAPDTLRQNSGFSLG